MNPAVVSCNLLFVLSEIWWTGLSDCCLPESLTKMFLKRLFQIVTMHKSRQSYEVFPSNGYQHTCATPSDFSAKDVWTNSVWTDPPPHLASIRKSRETVKFALCCKVLYLCPPQWHRCFLSSSLFPPPILPESSRKYSWLKGARWDSSFAGNRWNTWHCPESERGKGKFTMGWQPNNENLQMKTEEKDISN